jgi:hypothetical protein
MTWLVINPEKIVFAVGPEHDVFLQLQYPHERTGLVPGTELAIQMTSAQARAFASTLVRKAREAEAAKLRAEGRCCRKRLRFNRHVARCSLFLIAASRWAAALRWTSSPTLTQPTDVAVAARVAEAQAS